MSYFVQKSNLRLRDQSEGYGALDSVKNSSKPYSTSILAHSPQNTTLNRGFSALTLGTIGGAA
ncbi:hypothetical protein QUB61_30130 [Microcoleus sp. C2D2]